MSRIASLSFAMVVCVITSMVVIAATQTRFDAAPEDGQSVPLGGDAESTATPNAKQYPVIINKPSGPPRIELVGSDPQGRTGSVACSTCHSVRPPNPKNVSAASLHEFHLGMTFDHGTIACYACHNPDDADMLRMADGSSLAYQDVMTLCSQCHGTQATAYAHGAHGGMNGSWDLSRGPQTKNNCVDCHDPHAPSYPKMIVQFKPKDRFHSPADAIDEKGAAHDDQ